MFKSGFRRSGRPNSLPNPSRYERLERGWFRYPKAGETWSVKRQGCKVRWRNLKTKDLDAARMRDFKCWQRQAIGEGRSHISAFRTPAETGQIFC